MAAPYPSPYPAVQASGVAYVPFEFHQLSKIVSKSIPIPSYALVQSGGGKSARRAFPMFLRRPILMSVPAAG